MNIKIRILCKISDVLLGILVNITLGEHGWFAKNMCFAIPVISYEKMHVARHLTIVI